MIYYCSNKKFYTSNFWIFGAGVSEQKERGDNEECQCDYFLIKKHFSPQIITKVEPPMPTQHFLPLVSENESLWTPWVLMQTCKATYPSEMSTGMPILPAPPPPEPLQFELQNEEDSLLPVIRCPSKRARKRYTVNFKLVALQKVDEILQSDPRKSLCKACEEIGMSHANILKWKKNKQKLGAYNKRLVRSLHPGKSSQLEHIEAELLQFIFERRERALPVKPVTILLRAARLDNNFACKEWSTQYSTVQRFVKSHGYVHRLGTKVSQKDPRETAALAESFMKDLRPRLVEPCRDKR